MPTTIVDSTGHAIPGGQVSEVLANACHLTRETAEREFIRCACLGGLGGASVPVYLGFYQSVTAGCDTQWVIWKRGTPMYNQVLASARRRRCRRLLASVAALLGAVGSVVATTGVGPRAAAGPAEAAATQAATRVYTLPGNEVFANGIAVDGDAYYVTDFESGTIYRGDLDEPEADVFISGTDFGAGGIQVLDERLLVARGFAGVSLYERTTGAVIATWSVAKGSWALRIAIAPNGDAYITDADAPKLYRIPASELQDPSAEAQDLPVFLEWPDPPFHYERGFVNANGIVATPDGKFVLVGHETTGELFRVRLSDKQVRPVDLGRYRLISGRGMVLTDDRVLYVVRPARPAVARLRLDARYQRGRLLSETTDPTFDGPTDAAIAGDRLLVSNSQTVSSISLP